MKFLNIQFLGNHWSVWIGAVAVVAGVLLMLRLGKALLLRQLVAVAQKTKTPIDDMIADLLGRTKLWFLAFIALYAGSLLLALPAKVEALATKALVLAFIAQAAVWADRLLTYALERLTKQKADEDAAKLATMTVLGFIGRLGVWSAVLLLALDNLGFNITTLLAGLGVGGVAVALATQNVLGDLFASVSIVLDKPFVVGDFIIVGDFLGTVEYIGVKTTRLRSLSGEQLVFSNNDLLNSRIRNYKRMYERRIVFSLGVVYETACEKLQRIPDIIRAAIEAQEQTRFDRAHFKAYGDFALNFEIVYYVLNPDYNAYMDIQQAINLTIFRRFQEEQIAFAYPTQTLYLAKGSS
jgi:small-conductance mechanosensitive channel